MNAFAFAIVVGALLALLGASLGYGGGIPIGFAILPLALALVGVGTGGRALADPGMSPLVVALAVLLAACAIGLAVLAVAQASPMSFSTAASALLRPAFVIFVTVIVGFGVVGLLVGHLPAVPALAVVLGACLLAAGVAGLERVADIGFWLSVAGWVALGISDWGGGVTSSAGSSPGERGAR